MVFAMASWSDGHTQFSFVQEMIQAQAACQLQAPQIFWLRGRRPIFLQDRAPTGLKAADCATPPGLLGLVRQICTVVASLQGQIGQIIMPPARRESALVILRTSNFPW